MFGDDVIDLNVLMRDLVEKKPYEAVPRIRVHIV